MILTREWKQYLKELQDPEAVDTSSFEVQDTLNEELWSPEGELSQEVGDLLYEITKQFFNSLGLEGVDIVDVTLTGSLANYTWSNYSDIDLHILIDYSLIKEDQELIKNYLRKASTLWNKTHDIRIKGFEVEIYVQDSNETHFSGGVYSVQDDEWIEKPSREDPQIDFENVKRKAVNLMEDIDEVSELFKNKEYNGALTEAERVRQKIRKFRQAGLERGGVFSVENLAFKVLRRNGYLETLSSLRIMAYDKSMSLNHE